MSEKKRDLQFDFARVFAVCWIVGFTHLANYASETLKSLRVDFVADVTKTMLAVFMFISGYFLSKYHFESKQDVVSFYKKRLIRFYILFVLAAVGLFVMRFNPDVRVLITTLTGVSSYIPPQPKTLWFISMIAGFYILTPILSTLLHKIFKNIPLKILLCVIIFCCVYVLGNELSFDKRLYWCITCYCLGLVLGRTTIINEICKRPLLGCIFIVVYLLLLHTRICGYKYFNFDIIFGGLSLLFVSKWMCFKSITKIVSLISYASMAMYLFHRHIYILEHAIYKRITGEDCSIWYAYIIMFPSCIILGFYIQKLYDHVINHFSSRGV